MDHRHRFQLHHRHNQPPHHRTLPKQNRRNNSIPKLGIVDFLINNRPFSIVFLIFFLVFFLAFIWSAISCLNVEDEIKFRFAGATIVFKPESKWVKFVFLIVGIVSAIANILFGQSVRNIFEMICPVLILWMKKIFKKRKKFKTDPPACPEVKVDVV